MISYYCYYYSNTFLLFALLLLPTTTTSTTNHNKKPGLTDHNKPIFKNSAAATIIHPTKLYSKPISNDMEIDPETNLLYITDLQHYSIVVMDVSSNPTQYKVLVQNQLLLRYPSGLPISRGNLWISCSAMDEISYGKLPVLAQPYHILRIPLARITDLKRSNSYQKRDEL
jgi:hypothetical protein